MLLTKCGGLLQGRISYPLNSIGNLYQSSVVWRKSLHGVSSPPPPRARWAEFHPYIVPIDLQIRYRLKLHICELCEE